MPRALGPTGLGVAIMLAAAMPAAAQGAGARPDRLLAKASASFSPTPMDTPIAQVRETLKPLDSCGSNGECDFSNKDGVRLTFVDGPQYLVMKTIKFDKLKGRSVKALGIGTARAERQVLRNVRAFLPGATVTCLGADQSNEGDGISSCSARFTKGRIKLLFDRSGMLIDARVLSS